VSTEAVIVTKTVVSGGLGAVLFSFFNDTEIAFLVMTGLFSSLASYFYDWVHTHPRAFGLKQLSELIKYCFYGLALIFVVYFAGKENGSTYINLPNSAWGFIAALCAGSAVKIVAFIESIIPKIIEKRVK